VQASRESFEAAVAPVMRDLETTRPGRVRLEYAGGNNEPQAWLVDDTS
jgi:hypothetical protein